MFKVVNEFGEVAYEGRSFGAAFFNRNDLNTNGGNFKIVEVPEIPEEDYLNGDSPLYDDHPPLS